MLVMCVSQDMQGYAAITNTAPRPPFQWLKTTKIHFMLTSHVSCRSAGTLHLPPCGTQAQ